VQLGVMALGIVVAAGGALVQAPWRRSTQAATRTGLVVVANGKPPSLTLGDADALGASVGAIAPLAHRMAQLVHDDTNWQSNVHGTTPAYFDLRGCRLASGTLFTEADLDTGAKVVVLGPTTANQLFGSANPVGQMIRIQNLPIHDRRRARAQEHRR
jgi:putative ABC transport system permease protein